MNRYCCPNCGYNINYGDRFCGNCGSAIYYSGEIKNGYYMPSVPRNCHGSEVNDIKSVNSYIHNSNINHYISDIQKKRSNNSNTAASRPIRNEIFKLLSDLLTE